MEEASRLKGKISARSTSINEHPKIHSILIILVLIFLSFLAMILVYDILYSRTNVANEVLPFGPQIQNQRDKIIEKAIGWIEEKILPVGQNNSTWDIEKIINPEINISQLPLTVPPNTTNESAATKSAYYDNYTLNGAMTNNSTIDSSINGKIDANLTEIS
ncbi:MAG: hypothetical protein MUO26_10820, partial [Methanotrichaceae archaeon]|nr:hypothetical protein [Methanotrichaceae archaeon]